MKKICAAFILICTSPSWAVSDPTVRLKTISLGCPYNTPFQVHAIFSESVTGFVADNVNIINGIINNVNGNGASYDITVTPILPGLITLLIPSNSVKSINTGASNKASNKLKVTSLDPMLNPSSNFDLSSWILKQPIPLGDINHATVIGNTILNGVPTMNTGYSNPPYFFTDEATGAMVFFAPLNGATTDNSVFPLSQLSEQLPGKNAHWKLNTFKSNTLTASLQVSQMPMSKRIVIGAIQDDGDEDAFGNIVAKKILVKLYYDLNLLDPNKNTCNGCLYAQVRPTPAQENFLLKQVILAKNIHLNQLFTYKLVLLKDGTLTIKVNDASTIVKLSLSKDNTRGWGAQRLYFKAGVYMPENGLSNYIGGTAKFYSLQVKHVLA